MAKLKIFKVMNQIVDFPKTRDKIKIKIKIKMLTILFKSSECNYYNSCLTFNI